MEFESYQAAKSQGPNEGNHILANYDDNSIIVYQAFSPEIGNHATENQEFLRCKHYINSRMSWIKTSFLWMMYRSGWGTKKNQEVILAIRLKMSFFLEILEHAVPAVCYDVSQEGWRNQMNHNKEELIRLQWDPDHSARGVKHPRRRTIQLGLKGNWLRRMASGEEVLEIINISDFVAEQRARLPPPDDRKTPFDVLIPVERLFMPHLEKAVLSRIGLIRPEIGPDAKKLRILCLHGHRQDGALFQKRTQQLRKKLKPFADLVYISAPFPVLTPPSAHPGMSVDANNTDESKNEDSTSFDSNSISSHETKQEDLGRTWWYITNPDYVSKRKRLFELEEDMEIPNLEESLTYIQSVWEQQGPFDGLFGFSQGAGAVSLFIHCATQETSTVKVSLTNLPQFAIMVSGFSSPRPSCLQDYPPAHPYSLPTLHIFSEDDPYVPIQTSHQLASCYKDAEIFQHSKGHIVPQNKEDISVYTSFLSSLMSTPESSNNQMPK